MNIREENNNLYAKLRAGDKSAVNKIVEMNAGLVVSIVLQFIEHFPCLEHYRDDLVSEGFVAITEAARCLETRPYTDSPNVAAYLGTAIRRDVGEAADREINRHVKIRTLSRRRKAGKATPAPSTESRVDVYQIAQPYNDTGIAELREVIYKCCETEDEKRIIELRESSYSYNDVAAIMGLPSTTVFVTVRDIYKRFLDSTGIKGEV